MEIRRDQYLNQLIAKKNNGLIKIITGIRRCGKSYLLFNIYKKYLLEAGVDENHILCISLDDLDHMRYRNPLELNQYIKQYVQKDSDVCYVFIDEIQNVKSIENPYLPGEYIGFVDVLLGLMKLDSVDLYITGSNSKMLSSDIVTQFRDRGDEVRLYPLSYKEFLNAYTGDSGNAWREYYTYGGLPRIMYLKTHKEKMDYLNNLYENTYIKDVLERNDIRNNQNVLDDLILILGSSIGSLTNPTKLSNTFKSEKHQEISSNTIHNYLRYFEEAYLLEEAKRYDVKGKKYIETPLKYYFTDLGLCNAKINFRQQEENHIMENILFNELKIRGFSVDVGMVEKRYRDDTKKDIKKLLEVDFIAREGNKIYYIQSAFNIDSPEKREQEIQSLINIQDSFKKIVVVKEKIMPWYDDHGILYIGIEDFLLDQDSLIKY